MRFVSAFLLCLTAAAAQQVGQNAPVGGNASATFTASSQLVVETVSVTDKKGKPIEGLTAKDFTVTEDGVPQAIRIFEYQTLPEAPAVMPAAPQNIHIYD